MKKRFGIKMAAIALAAATAVPIAAGCGAGGGTTPDVTKMDPAVLMQEVQTNMNNVTAMDFSMDMDIGITSPLLGEEPMTMDMDMDMVYSQNPLQMMMEMNASVYGQSAYTGMYLVPNGNSYTAYLGEQDMETGSVTWQKTSVSGEDAAELEQEFGTMWGDEAGMQQAQQLQNMLQGAMSLQITGMDQINGEAAVVMSGQMNLEDAMNAMSAVGGESMMGDMGGMEAMFNNVTVPVTYYIDADEYTLLKCDMDMQAMLTQVFSQIGSLAGSMEGMEGMENVDFSQLIQINTAYISMQINAVNEDVAGVTVPQEIISQAVEVGDSISVEEITPLLNGAMMGV